LETTPQDSAQENEQDNGFWVFSLAFYAQPDVATTCLALQDRHGCDVNWLLYCLWLARSRRRFDTEQISAVVEQCAQWRQQVVEPLRAVRRQLKGRAAVADFRERVKTLELDAEQQQQSWMWQAHERCSMPDEQTEQTVLARDNTVCWLQAEGRLFTEEAWQQWQVLLARL